MDSQINNDLQIGMFELMKNINIDIKLEGWSASSVFIVGFLTSAVMYGMKVFADYNNRL